MDSPADLWDQAVASATRTLTTTTSAPRSFATLPIRREPRRDHLPAVDRSAALIPAPLRDAFRLAAAGKSAWPLFVQGPVGVGKTCSALALCDWVNGATWFTTASGWASDLVEAGKGNLSWRGEAGNVTVTPDMLRRRVERAALVVLDELAMRDRVSDWHYECVKDLIDLRHGRPLVVLSNLGLKQVGAIYDDRITDRLRAGTGISLVGASRRREAGRTPPASAHGQA